jgi:hypothetical protein
MSRPDAVAEVVRLLDGHARTPEDHEALAERIVHAVLEEAPDKVWLNAFSCVNPSDKFAAEVGHDIISNLMATPKPDKAKDPFAPFKRTYFRVVCS